MDLQRWIHQLGTTFRNIASRRRNSRSLSQLSPSQIGNIDPLEPRILLTSDFGDAPDISTGVAKNDYQTLASNGGSSHVIDGSANKLFLGAGVDGEPGNQQSLTAMLDDQFTTGGRDDEDGVLNSLDLINTLGAPPVVTLQATNLTGRSAKLSGWIDYNQNGVFDNATERDQITVPGGTTNGRFTLTFPLAPGPVVGKTYARFRLSTDAAASNPTGVASDGEVEDYPFEIRNRVARPFELSRSTQITSGLNGGPTLAANDLYGISIAAIGDLDGNGVTDLAIGAAGDDTGGTNRGAVYVTLMNADGTTKSFTKIAHQLHGGPTLANEDYFGRRMASLGDLDGDGITDIAVGAVEEPNGLAGGRTGSVYIINLKTDGTAKHVTRISSGLNGGPVLSDGDGFAMVESLGDLDGDGVVDLAVGAPDADGEKTDQGIVYILYLKSDRTVKRRSQITHVDWWSRSTIANDKFGSYIANLGDMDHDGTLEIAVTASNLRGLSTAYAHIISLKSDGTYTFNNFINSSSNQSGPLSSSGAISGITSIGDIDGDGINDLALTLDSLNEDYISGGPGAVFLLTMNSYGTVKNYYRIAAETSGSPSFANQSLKLSSLRFLGDTNGDGSPELAVGMPYNGGSDTAKGSVYVFSLRNEIPNTSIPDVPRIEPPDLSVSSTWPTIVWSEDPHATQYEIWLRNDSTGVVISNETVQSTSYIKIGTYGIGRYSVCVRARNEKGYSAWSARRGFTIDRTVSFLRVPNGIDGRPTATWSGVDGATNYDIWIRCLSNSRTAPVQARIPGPAVSFVANKDLAIGKYRIYVRAVAADGTPAAWTNGDDFEVGITTVVTKVTNQISLHPTIAWEPVPGAAKYVIWVSEEKTPTVQKFGVTTDSNLTSYALSTDLPSGRYTVWIRALTLEGKAGAWSVGKTFGIAVVPIPSASAFPGTSYYDGDFTDVQVSWDNVEDAVSYDVKWLLPGTEGSFETNATRHASSRTSNSARTYSQGKLQAWVRAVGADGSKSDWSLPVEVIAKKTVAGLQQTPLSDVPSQPQFTWNDASMVRYEVEIRDMSRAWSVVVRADNVTSNVYQVPTDLPIGDFKLWVRGISANETIGNWSNSYAFSYRPVAVPTSIDASFNQTPELHWGAVKSAVSYDVVVRSIKTGQTVVDMRNVVGTSMTTIPLPESQYKWWVIPNGTGAVKGKWSDVRTFEITSSPLYMTVPVRFIFTGGDSVRLKWTSVPGAASYGIFIQDLSNPSPVFHHDYETTTNEFIVPTTPPIGDYRAWVRAVGSAGALGKWSGGTEIFVN